MSRYIDGDALREQWLCLTGNDFKASDFVRTIDEQPTIDAKQGEWMSYSPCTCICSVCSFIVSDWFVSKFRYCPNCGARMDEE